jgi:hypothetical protein
MEADGQGHVAPDRAPSAVPKQHPCSFTSLGGKKAETCIELTFPLTHHHAALTPATCESLVGVNRLTPFLTLPVVPNFLLFRHPAAAAACARPACSLVELLFREYENFDSTHWPMPCKAHVVPLLQSYSRPATPVGAFLLFPSPPLAFPPSLLRLDSPSAPCLRACPPPLP